MGLREEMEGIKATINIINCCDCMTIFKNISDVPFSYFRMHVSCAHPLKTSPLLYHFYPSVCISIAQSILKTSVSLCYFYSSVGISIA